MARLKMSLWESVIADCNECLKLSPSNMKAHYYLSQAHLPLKDYPEALHHALQAYDLCVKTQDKSLSSVTAQVLRCKKEKWEHEEKIRKRETGELEEEMLRILEREKEQAVEECDETERAEVQGEWERKMEVMRGVFERARTEGEKRRKVPEWAIDDIGFGFMHDPVIVSMPGGKGGVG